MTCIFVLWSSWIPCILGSGGGGGGGSGGSGGAKMRWWWWGGGGETLVCCQSNLNRKKGVVQHIFIIQQNIHNISANRFSNSSWVLKAKVKQKCNEMHMQAGVSPPGSQKSTKVSAGVSSVRR